MQGENILLEEIAKLKSMVRNTEKAYQERRSTNMQGENILLEEIAKLKSMVRNTEKAYQEKARLWIEQTGALAALDGEVGKLKTELDATKFELMQMKRRVLVADANTNRKSLPTQPREKKMHTAFAKKVKDYAAESDIPMLVNLSWRR